MTREAKIGMLTGLGVIILIGVLLSEYLGDTSRVGTQAGPTNRMAPLPVGSDYRRQIMSPLGVPALASGGPRNASVSIQPVTPVVPPAYAAEPIPHREPSGPVIGEPVAMMPLTQSPDVRDPGGTPGVITLDDRAVATLGGSRQVAVSEPPPAATPVVHVVVAGDTLTKIARKHFGSANASDLQKIVAANPQVLKNVNSVLVTGRKLNIPLASAPASPSRPAAQPSPPAEPVVVLRPGDLSGEAQRPALVPPARTTTPSPAPATKVYRVKAGDTLEKIARRLAPANPADMVQKIKTLNNMPDANRLYAGSTIKIPA